MSNKSLPYYTILYCQEGSFEGLKFNTSKCVQQISFLSRLYITHGLLPDSKKIEDITQRPVPEDKPDLQPILGTVNFIALYLSKLLQVTTPLCNLLKKTNV